MSLNLESVKLTQKQKDEAEQTLHNWSELNKVVAKLNLDGLRRLLVYELTTRSRLTVVQRLVARYGVLEQRENEKEVAAYLAEKFKKDANGKR